MCGICGIATGNPREAINPAVLRAMNAVLVHRGPDDGGDWNGGHIGLAMRRLRVIDPEGGQQPMTILGGDLALVFNGEIYNFQELRGELQRLGAEFQTQCDTEVILWGYEKWGGKLLERLNGMFAFALYDRRVDRLLIARDRLGIKPLYYAQHGRQFAFASELESLRRSCLLTDAIDPAALDAYLEFGFVPAPDTIYTDAKKLLPGEMLVYENGGIATERYWRIEWDQKQDWTPRTASLHYRHLLEESVAAQRVADVPLGAFLSGGIDSSSVVAILARLSGEPIKTFTIGFDDANMDETAYARLVAERYGTDHHERIIRPDAVSLLPKLVRHFGEPFADSSAIPTYLVSRLARAHVTVALSGDGGDELFAGYSWMHMDRRVRRYRLAPRFLRRGLDKALFFVPGGIRAEKVRRFSRDSFLEPYLSFRRRHATLDSPTRAALLTPEWARAAQHAGIDRWRDRAAEAGEASPDDWMLHQDTAFYLPDDILTKVDRMSMAAGLEARVPILDHRIVEFAATLPFRLKQRGRRSKLVVKDALKDLLPKPVLRQRKQGFSIPIHRWFREELREPFHDLVLGPNALTAGFLERTTVERIAHAHAKGRENHGHALYAMLMLEHWLRLRAEG